MKDNFDSELRKLWSFGHREPRFWAGHPLQDWGLVLLLFIMGTLAFCLGLAVGVWMS